MTDAIKWPTHIPDDVADALRNVEASPYCLSDRPDELGAAARRCLESLADLCRALHSLPWLEPGEIADDASIPWPAAIGEINVRELERLEMSARISGHYGVTIRLARGADALSDFESELSKGAL